MLEDSSRPFQTLLVTQGWEVDDEQVQYVITDQGTYTYILPIKTIEDAVVSAILTLSVLNQTPIYGVMGFLMDGEALAGFAEFPEKTRARLQMTPSFASIITIFDKEVLPRLLDFLT